MPPTLGRSRARARSARLGSRRRGARWRGRACRVRRRRHRCSRGGGRRVLLLPAAWPGRSSAVAGPSVGGGGRRGCSSERLLGLGQPPESKAATAQKLGELFGGDGRVGAQRVPASEDTLTAV